MSSKRDLVTFIFFLITLFIILSFLEIRTESRQKSISVEEKIIIIIIIIIII
jgi:preprotein translocase subunit YajC